MAYGTQDEEASPNGEHLLDPSRSYFAEHERAPDGTFGRVRFPPGGHPKDREAWGDRDYGVTEKGAVRCTAYKKNGQRCAGWSMVGTTLCNIHGGPMMLANGKHQSMYGTNLLDPSTTTPRSIGQALIHSRTDPDALTGVEEAHLARAILGTAVGNPKLLERINSGNLDPEIAELMLKLVRETQGIALAAGTYQLKTKRWVSVKDFYVIVNQLLTTVVSEIQRTAKTPQAGERAIMRIAQHLDLIEIEGERIFTREAPDAPSDAAPDEDGALPPDDDAPDERGEVQGEATQPQEIKDEDIC